MVMTVFDPLEYDSDFAAETEVGFHEGPVADFIFPVGFSDSAFAAGEATRGEGGASARGAAGTGCSFQVISRTLFRFQLECRFCSRRGLEQNDRDALIAAAEVGVALEFGVGLQKLPGHVI
jgi:hypothetical protein